MDISDNDRQSVQDDMEEYLKMENSKLVTREDFEKHHEGLDSHEKKPK